MPSASVDKRSDANSKQSRGISISSVAITVLGLVEGVISLVFMTFLAYRDKTSQELPNSSDGEYIDNFTPSNHLWSLSTQNKTFEHNFLSLSNGVQLHYITPPAQQTQPKAKLIVFLHGFPDSCHLWSHVFASSLLSHANLVALDLPGCGGSDGLLNYGPDEVLATVANAISELRRQYGIDKNDAQCVVVGHDWGGIIASRIAAATEGLIDHLVMVNSVFPPHFLARGKLHAHTALALFGKRPAGETFAQCLPRAKHSGSVVIAQLLKSHYIFLFNLPFFSVARFPGAMRYLLTYCHRKAAPENPTRGFEWHHAASLGPTVAECEDGKDKGHYGSSVLTRALAQPDRIWDERIHLYRDGLMGRRWRTIPTNFLPSGTTGRVDESKIRCTTTVVFGLDDQALDPRLVVDGIQDHVWLRNGFKGRVVEMQGIGHWSPLNPKCIEVVEKVISGADSKAIAEAGKFLVQNM